MFQFLIFCQLYIMVKLAAIFTFLQQYFDKWNIKIILHPSHSWDLAYAIFGCFRCWRRSSVVENLMQSLKLFQQCPGPFEAQKGLSTCFETVNFSRNSDSWLKPTQNLVTNNNIIYLIGSLLNKYVIMRGNKLNCCYNIIYPIRLNNSRFYSESVLNSFCNTGRLVVHNWKEISFENFCQWEINALRKRYLTFFYHKHRNPISINVVRYPLRHVR